MESEKITDSDHKKLTENGAQTSPATPLLEVEKRQDLDAKPTDNKADDGGASKPRNPPSAFRVWIKKVSLTDWITAASTFVIMCWAGLQWWEMHGAGEQTDRIIAADERVASAMESTVNQANDAFTGTV